MASRGRDPSDHARSPCDVVTREEADGRACFFFFIMLFLVIGCGSRECVWAHADETVWLFGNCESGDAYVVWESGEAEEGGDGARHRWWIFGQAERKADAWCRD